MESLIHIKMGHKKHKIVKSFEEIIVVSNDQSDESSAGDPRLLAEFYKRAAKYQRENKHLLGENEFFEFTWNNDLSLDVRIWLKVPLSPLYGD